MTLLCRKITLLTLWNHNNNNNNNNKKKTKKKKMEKKEETPLGLYELEP